LARRALIGAKDEKTSAVLAAEVDASRAADSVSALLLEYANRATKLGLLPESAPHAHGRRLGCELVAAPRGSAGSAKVLSIDLLETLKPALAELKVSARLADGGGRGGCSFPRHFASAHGRVLLRRASSPLIFRRCVPS